jgi:hypothetical protein
MGNISEHVTPKQITHFEIINQKRKQEHVCMYVCEVY